MTATAVNTKHAERRDIAFASVGELLGELERIEEWHRAGTLRTTGNWTPGQNLGHCALVWQAAIDGFPPEAKPPAILVLLVKLFFKRKALRGASPPPGIRMPKVLDDALVPDAGLSFEDGLGRFRAQIARTESGGERFRARSPLLGEVSHDEWTLMQLGHCRLHLGFLHLA